MLGILCGIESEAVIARRVDGAVVACAGARPQKARWLARELIKKGATRLMSFGIAGGLEPGLPIGSLVVGSQVSSVDSTWACDDAWINKLSHSLPEGHCGGVWGSEFLVPTATDKAALYHKSRCLIVDMESQAAAQVAAEANVPLAVVRAVCDTSDMDVPPVVMASIKEDGSINYTRAIGHILRHPSEVPDLFHMGKGTSRALKVLEGAVVALKDN
jgi:adenosylhomocysteine nucleosidase